MLRHTFLSSAEDAEKLGMENLLAISLRDVEYFALVFPVDSPLDLFDVKLFIEHGFVE